MKHGGFHADSGNVDLKYFCMIPVLRFNCN